MAIIAECVRFFVLITQQTASNIYGFCERKVNGVKDPKTAIEFTDDEIAIQAQYICDKYMEQKFALKESYRDVFKTPTSNTICSNDVLKTMIKFGRILEKGYPKLYTDVVDQLNFRINYEIVVCGLFTCVCDNILAEGATWAKIVSMYAFAGALACDCCKVHDYKTAKNISKWMGQYFRKRLIGWIRSHGGWDGFAAHFNSSCLFSSGSRRCTWMEGIMIAASGIALAGICTILVHASIG